MNGPEHYEMAERLLAALTTPGGQYREGADRAIARAQVHATLAGVAAVVDAAYRRMAVPADLGWDDVMRTGGV